MSKHQTDQISDLSDELAVLKARRKSLEAAQRGEPPKEKPRSLAEGIRLVIEEDIRKEKRRIERLETKPNCPELVEAQRLLRKLDPEETLRVTEFIQRIIAERACGTV